MATLMPCTEAERWNELILALPDPHLLQSWEWGAVKSKYGWRASHLIWRNDPGQVVAAAQVLERRLRFPLLSSLPVIYVPKGPLLDWSKTQLRAEVLLGLGDYAADRGAIFIKIDPNVPLGVGFTGEEGSRSNPLGEQVRRTLREGGWRFSREQIQFRNTMTIDLKAPEDELLAEMKQKTRYNVRLAGRRGVIVRPGGVDDLDLLYRIYSETAVRDGFAIRNREYYQTVWGDFINQELAQPFIAEVEDQPVAGLIAYRFGATAWYLYGMSRDLHRDKMPNYLLQWEAMRWAKTQGCSTYDLWGAPTEASEDDPLWGVYRFKAGFGAQVLRTIGAWDLPKRPALYAAYSTVLPPIMTALRAFGRLQTQRDLD
jgi:lipid II:glycine glycyltransferase (peptidoglycan interpeptide bridge formation enzyme)